MKAPTGPGETLTQEKKKGKTREKKRQLKVKSEQISKILVKTDNLVQHSSFTPIVIKSFNMLISPPLLIINLINLIQLNSVKRRGRLVQWKNVRFVKLLRPWGPRFEARRGFLSFQAARSLSRNLCLTENFHYRTRYNHATLERNKAVAINSTV